MNNINFQVLIRIILFIILLSAIILLHYVAWIYLYPFIIAIIISAILQPIVLYMERSWRLHRTLASYLTIIIFCSFILLLIFLLIQRLGKELSHIIEILPTIFMKINHLFIYVGQTQLIPLYEYVQAKLAFLPESDVFDMEQVIPFLMDKLYDSSSTVITNIFSSISVIITSISQTSMIIIFITLSIFIMTRDFALIKTFFRRIIPVKVKEQGAKIIVQLKKSTFGLVKAHFFLAFLSSCFVFIGLLIFGIEHVLVITILIFIFDLVPYIGIGIIFIPWVIYLFMNGDYITTIQLSCLYIMIIVIRQIIEPKIIASHLGIHPLIALIILFISIQHLGIIGIFLTPLLLIVMSAIYHSNILTILFNVILDKK